MDSVLDVSRIYFLALLFALLIERVMEILIGAWNYFEWRIQLYNLWNRKAEKLRKKFKNNFDLCNFSINIARNSILSGEQLTLGELLEVIDLRASEANNSTQEPIS